MEKLDQSKSKNYTPLVMWAGDLEELFSEIEKHCSNIVFVADDVKYESVDEFIRESKNRSPSIVKITASDPYLTVDLHHAWARFYISSSQILASGLFLKIDSILSRCERKPKFSYSYVWAVGSTWVFPNIFYLAPLMPYKYLNH
jgi:hypothetical protein